jgi:hypothetical protein
MLRTKTRCIAREPDQSRIVRSRLACIGLHHHLGRKRNQVQMLEVLRIACIVEAPVTCGGCPAGGWQTSVAK